MEDDSKCGIGCFRPDSLQCFTTIKYFTFFYSISALMSSTLSVYVSSQITTLEKQFGFTSTQSGFLMSCNDIGYLSVTLFISYLADKLHAPRVLSLSTVLFGVAGIICTIPYFISPSKQLVNQKTHAISNKTLPLSPYLMPSTKLCDTSRSSDQFHQGVSCESQQEIHSYVGVANSFTPVAMSIIAMGMIIQGIGKSPRQAFVTVFIDSNVPKTQTAVYVGCVIGISIFGPALGMGLGGLLTRIYVTLEGNTNLCNVGDMRDHHNAHIRCLPNVNISPRDPRWIGAWWLGFLAFGLGSILTAIPVMCFPRRLHKIPIKKAASDSHKSKISIKKFAYNFFKQMFELLRNKLYVLIVLGKCLSFLVVSGGMAFGPKYLETQFNLPAWKANMLIGLSKLVTISIGTFMSGFLTTKKKLAPLQCSKVIVLISLLGTVYYAIVLGIGCGNPEITGYNKFYPNATIECVNTCKCGPDEYFPICGSDMRNYMSPCYAGCTVTSLKVFSNCSCIDDGGTAVPGLCTSDCDMLIPFIILSCVFGLLDALTIMPTMIFLIRSVRDNQKGIAIALSAFMTSLCGWFLGPLVFEEIIDLCCQIWSSKCGAKGSCALYDNDHFRYAIFGTTLAIRFIVFLFDSVCYFLARTKTDWSTKDAFETNIDIEEKDGFINNEEKETVTVP